MKNTTIIIPIFNRHDHIESLIEYYKGFKVIFSETTSLLGFPYTAAVDEKITFFRLCSKQVFKNSFALK